MAGKHGREARGRGPVLMRPQVVHREDPEGETQVTHHLPEKSSAESSDHGLIWTASSCRCRRCCARGCRPPSAPTSTCRRGRTGTNCTRWGVRGRPAHRPSSEEHACTTEPGSAQRLRVPGRLEGRAGPVRAFEEHAQNGVRRETVPDPLAVRTAPFALLRNTRKTECGAKQFLIPWLCAPHPLRF